MTKKVFFVLAMVGFILPNVMLGIFIADEGFDLRGYFSAWTDSTAPTQLMADLAIAEALVGPIVPIAQSKGSERAVIEGIIQFARRAIGAPLA